LKALVYTGYLKKKKVSYIGTSYKVQYRTPFYSWFGLDRLHCTIKENKGYNNSESVIVVKHQ
jgi:hypothetical protein